MSGNIIGYVMLALLSAAVLLTVLSGPIVDWLSAREKRKKAAAANATAAAPSAPAPPAANPA